MQNSEASAVAAPKIERATKMMLDALATAGVENDPTVCLAAIGAVMGCMALASGNPGESMRAMNAVANGIIEGSLLDP